MSTWHHSWRLIAGAWCVLLALAVLSMPAAAQGVFERLMVPGDVIQGHA
ncbi:MAG: hypothetical protein ABL893_02890 [Hyphomicrobium sp.]